jgi:hypothetical protein
MAKKRLVHVGWWLLLLFISFGARAQPSLLDSLLYSDTSAVVRQVLASPDKYKVQILYTQLDYSGAQPSLQTYSFRLRPSEYFYPASLVKLPQALLALEYLNMLGIEGLDKHTPVYTNSKYSGGLQGATIAPSVADNILQMMVVSDNDAYNRLYDLLGQEYMHLRLFEKGYTDVRLIQRFAPASPEENRTSGPFRFVDTTGYVLYEEEKLVTTQKFLNPAANTKVGQAYWQGRRKVPEGKDFYYNNFIPLADLHQMLVSVVYPEAVEASTRFELSAEDLRFLKYSMSVYPRETGVQAWANEKEYYDNFRKFLYYGQTPQKANPVLRIYNKVGLAYGFMGDVAYFADYESNVEFFLSAVLYANEDEILNDNRYDYATIGFPFLERLGKLIYAYECTRPASVRNPALSEEGGK